MPDLLQVHNLSAGYGEAVILNPDYEIVALPAGREDVEA